MKIMVYGCLCNVAPREGRAVAQAHPGPFLQQSPGLLPSGAPAAACVTGCGLVKWVAWRGMWSCRPRIVFHCFDYLIARHRYHAFHKASKGTFFFFLTKSERPSQWKAGQCSCEHTEQESKTSGLRNPPSATERVLHPCWGDVLRSLSAPGVCSS